MKRKIDELTEEDFALFPVSRIQFRRRELWCAMFVIVGYGCVMNVAWHTDVPIARTVAMGYLIAALLFSLPCLFFTSKQSILQHKIAYLKCRSISLILFRLAFLQFFTIFSVCLYCDSWNHPDEAVANILYAVAGIFVVEDLVISFFARRRMKKCLTNGDYRKGGSGFFGKLSGTASALTIVCAFVSPYLIAVSYITYALSRVIDVRIKGRQTYLFFALVFFMVYHLIMYVCIYGQLIIMGTCYHYKLFVKDKEEIYKDSAERGIGFIFVRLILLVIILLILYLAVNFIYAVRLFGWNKILNE